MRIAREIEQGMLSVASAVGRESEIRPKNLKPLSTAPLTPATRPKPFAGTKSADDSLCFYRSLLAANLRLRALASWALPALVGSDSSVTATHAGTSYSSLTLVGLNCIGRPI